MRRSGFLAVAAVTAFLFAASTASATTWDKNSIKCRAKISKGAAKVVKAVEKGIGKCFKDSFKGGGTGANCYTSVAYDAKGKVASAQGKLVAGAAKCKNPGATMIAEYGGACPSPGTPAVIATLADLHACVGTLSEALTVNAYQDLMRTPASESVTCAVAKDFP